MTTTRNILVLARRDQAEAMRVAAGLTIFGHRVDLVFLDRPVAETADNIEQAELLELSGIEPLSTVDDPNIEGLGIDQLAALMDSAQTVISL